MDRLAPWLSEPSFTGSPSRRRPPRKGAAAGCPLEMIEKSSLSSAAAAHPFHQRRPLHYINCRSSFHPIEFSPPPPHHPPFSHPTPPLFLIADKLDVAAASLKQINLTRSRNLLCPCRSRAAMMSLAEGGE